MRNKISYIYYSEIIDASTYKLYTYMWIQNISFTFNLNVTIEPITVYKYW